MGGRRALLPMNLTLVTQAGRDLDAVRDLFLEYGESLAFNTCFGGFDEELAGLPGDYAAPGGVLLLAREGSRVAGCIAVRPVDSETCEMRRLFVRPAFRGAGIGRSLAVTALTRAEGLGYHRMCLETLPTMMEARSLYASLGFRPCAPYYDNRAMGSDCFELLLRNVTRDR